MIKKKIQKKAGKKKLIGRITSEDIIKKMQSAQILETPARAKLRDKIGEEELKKIESGLANIN